MFQDLCSTLAQVNDKKKLGVFSCRSVFFSRPFFPLGASPKCIQQAKVSLINYQPALDQITVQLPWVGVLLKQHLTSEDVYVSPEWRDQKLHLLRIVQIWQSGSQTSYYPKHSQRSVTYSGSSGLAVMQEA